MKNLDWFVGPKPTHPAGDLEHGSLSEQALLSVVSVASCSKRIAVFRLSGQEGRRSEGVQPKAASCLEQEVTEVKENEELGLVCWTKPTHPAGDLEHGLLSEQALLSVVSVASCSKRIAVFRLSDQEGRRSEGV